MFVSRTDTRSDGEQNSLELEILFQKDGFAQYPATTDLLVRHPTIIVSFYGYRDPSILVLSWRTNLLQSAEPRPPYLPLVNTPMGRPPV